ncbi:S-adenosyl-L-methionine-dependent methyltransferase [Amniculicola lignicola CBS 123094]|uniref:S-adenosyl-L-methionine-dependent methyltransferase n=1 Tax=Amniculicola lignicola CBS 123094 TaxID=1392246 RepID=A0A6A5WBR5_9PLEO|nr:S-adenosyl-L-methionine-dependent methyltransferase [Amniculicola lignicola CBS 123094]
MGTREYWCDWYDVQGRLLDGFDKGKGDGVLLVDIGGGKGHDLQAFDERFGAEGNGKEGVLVLQEMKEVLQGIGEGDLDAKAMKMVYDFFTPQRVKGARAYFLHHILHDWSDKYCHLILKNIREAMTPGYSKLLIHNLVLPDTGTSEIQA